jgi:hypothetical protein
MSEQNSHQSVHVIKFRYINSGYSPAGIIVLLTKMEIMSVRWGGEQSVHIHMLIQRAC